MISKRYGLIKDLIMELQNQEQASLEYAIFKDVTKRIKKYVGEIQGKMMLDIGCGFSFPQTLLHHSCGHNIIGIDIDVMPCLRRITKGSDFHTPNLLETIYKLIYKRIHLKTLDNVSPFSVKTNNIDVRNMDATDMSFPNEMFDIVISNASFEHIPNVPKAISEMKRVMKNGAIAHIGIHLFTSLSGGHNLPPSLMKQNPPINFPKNIDPWDHLRKRQLPIPPDLNQLRENEFKEMFSQELEILEWVSPNYREGEHLLTPEIRDELSDYSEEELKKRWVIVIAKRKIA